MAYTNKGYDFRRVIIDIIVPSVVLLNASLNHQGGDQDKNIWNMGKMKKGGFLSLVYLWSIHSIDTDKG